MASTIGLGIDIVSVKAVQDSIDSEPSYVARVFTAIESSYAQSCADPYQILAGRLAAKEATMKALGTGWTDEVDWKDIEITNHPDGRPELHVLGGSKSRLDELGATSVWISISHTPQYACAVVLLEKN
ncbi:MAG TPA: holo-ACP synthase [Candidatus Angelobacter sp.]|jgi:holo-[acyl-carrier protein] synthase|nr:holo-ACP synthase [Candidatus Angelobacter sp.]